MEIIIIKSFSNKKFISKKHKDYYTLSWLTKRLWLSKEVPIVSDGSVIYKLSFFKGLSIEGKIFGSGFDEIGFYIIFSMQPFNLNNDIKNLCNKRISCGKANLLEVFNPHKDDAFKSLVDDRFDGVCYFNNVIMNNNRTDTGLILDFELGSLGDQALHIELSEITSEECYCENNGELDSFKDGKIKDIYFRKSESGDYIIHINNSREDRIYPKDYNCFSEVAVNPKIVEHKNEYIIKCRNIHIERYNYFIKKLTEKGIKCFKLNNTSKQSYVEIIIEKWKESFLCGVDIDNIYIDDYLWHVFSYEKLNAISGIDASNCLNKVDKNSLYIFSDDVNKSGKAIGYRIENATNFNFEMLQCYVDVYVTDKKFTWTYVRTHEDGYCGPYFYKKVQIKI